MPVSVLYMVSLNYHKMGNHKSSLYYFNQLIKKAYLKIHVKVIKALKRDEVDEVKIPKILKFTKFCKYITDQNINIIFTVIGMYKEIRDWNKKKKVLVK